MGEGTVIPRLAAAALLVALVAACESSVPTSPDPTPGSAEFTVVAISGPAGQMSPGAVLPTSTAVRIGGSYFLSEQDLQPIRDFVWVWVCFGHEATTFRTACSGQGGKAAMGRTAVSMSSEGPPTPLDTEFIHLLLIEQTESGDSLVPRSTPSATYSTTHYPVSNVTGRLIAHRALAFPIQWR
jgi:hypothetical protein